MIHGAPRDYKDFCDTLAMAKPGDMIAYHTGMISVQRDPFGMTNAPDWAAIGEIAWKVGAPKKFVLAPRAEEPIKAHGFGAADLTQRRIDTGKYEYRLTMRRRLDASEVSEIRRVGMATVKDVKRIRGDA